jgi:hypothetical protein
MIKNVWNGRLKSEVGGDLYSDMTKDDDVTFEKDVMNWL